MLITMTTTNWISGIAVPLAIATGQDSVYSIPLGPLSGIERGRPAGCPAAPRASAALSC
jgi:hypothetical protein